MSESFNALVAAQVNEMAARAVRTLVQAQATRQGMTHTGAGAAAQGRKIAELRSQADSWVRLANMTKAQQDA